MTRLKCFQYYFAHKNKKRAGEFFSLLEDITISQKFITCEDMLYDCSSSFSEKERGKVVLYFIKPKNEKQKSFLWAHQYRQI